MKLKEFGSRLTVVLTTGTTYARDSDYQLLFQNPGFVRILCTGDDDESGSSVWYPVERIQCITEDVYEK